MSMNAAPPELFVKSMVESTTKAGKPYLKFILRDKTGKDYIGVSWDNVDEIKSTIKEGEIYGFDADLGQYNGEPQFTVYSGILVKDANVFDYMDTSPVDPKEVSNKLISLLESQVTDPRYRRLVDTFYGTKTLRSQFWTVPATLKLHHTYPGGLVHYTYKCVEIAVDLCSKYPSIDKDLLLTACLFHDSGKILEYTLKGATFVKTDIGKLTGHSNLSWGIVSGLTSDDPTLPYLVKLQHILLSHHTVEGSSSIWTPGPMVIKEGELLIRISSIVSVLGHYDLLQKDETGWSQWNSVTETKKYLA